MDEESDLIPIGSYDFRRARLSAALHWIVDAAFNGEIPNELQDPLPLKERDTVTAIYVNTGLVSLLINSSLYIQASINLLPNYTSLWKQGEGHWAVIQGLSRLGIYVEDSNGQAFTEKELVQSSPFHLSAHVTICECLMAAYLQEHCSVDTIVQNIRLLGRFNASEDLPIDNEDALLLWMNKVCAACINHQRKSQSITTLINNNHHNSSHNGESTDLITPHMEDILKDICDGVSLCVLISFYCPNLLPFTSFVVSEACGLADSLHNLTLVKKFCIDNLPGSVYIFSHEDLIYGAESIKPALLAFLTKLLYYFVNNPLPIVKPRTNVTGKDKTIAKKLPSSTAARSSPSQRVGSGTSSQRGYSGEPPNKLISNKTKQTFNKNSRESSLHLSGDCDLSSSNPSLNQLAVTPGSKLLNKRSSLITSNDNMHDTLSPIVVRKSQSMLSLNTPDTKQSLVAWENNSYFIDRQKTKPHSCNTSLLSNVELDDTEEKTPKMEPRKKSNDSPRQKPEPSHSYKQLLSKGTDFSNTLQQFADKYNIEPERSSRGAERAGRANINGSHDDTELTHVTPRSSRTPVGQSYVISTSSSETGKLAGIPAIDDSNTFTSLTNDVENDRERCEPVNGVTTSFATIRAERSEQSSTDGTEPRESLTGSLKERYQNNNKAKTQDGVESKPVKKTTFSINSTTWTDSAQNLRENKLQYVDSDSENSEHGSSTGSTNNKHQFNDVKLLLDEKRKAIEKKKTQEELNRKKELNTASRGAFLQSVSRNKSNKNTRTQEPFSAFSRNDIAQSIEDLTSKWSNDQKSHNKRGKTTPGQIISTPAPELLDNISEVTEGESVVNQSQIENRNSDLLQSTAQPETTDDTQPLDINQYGLEELNKSLSQLKGQMDRLSADQQKIQSLQKSLRHSESEKSSRQSPVSQHSEKSPTPTSSETRKKSPPPFSETRKKSPTPPPTVSEQKSTSPPPPETNIQAQTTINNTVIDSCSLHYSDLDSSTKSRASHPTLASNYTTPQSITQPHVTTTQSQTLFSEPQAIMTQSTEGPFVLHGKKTPKSNSKKTTPKPSSGRTTPSSGGGFLSSKELSRSRQSLSTVGVETTTPQTPDTPDGSARKRWGSHNAPLFPGYEDTPMRELGARIPSVEPADVFIPPTNSRPEYIPPDNVPHRDRTPLAIIPQDTPTLILKQNTHTPAQTFSQSAARPPVNHHPSLDDTPIRDTNIRPSAASASNYVDDTPMRDMNPQPGVYERLVYNNTPVCRVENVRGVETPVDSPLRLTSGKNRLSLDDSNEMFYIPPSKPSPSVVSSNFPLTQPANMSSIDTPQREILTAQSRHGTIPLTQPSSSNLYKLQTPYGTADNEFQLPQPVNLNSALNQLSDEPQITASFSNTNQPEPYYTQALSSMDTVLADIGYKTSQTADSWPITSLTTNTLSNAAVTSNTWSVPPNTTFEPPTHDVEQREPIQQEPVTFSIPNKSKRRPAENRPAENRPAENRPAENRPPSANETAGTVESEETPRTARKTWNMSTPSGDLLNQPGVGFVVAQQNQISEDEIQKRKEKVLLMQLKRREETERKKLQKEAELAAKREQTRHKEVEAERKKAVEKAKKDAILHEYQLRKQEEELPPEVRSQFRQKQEKKNRPASIHWAGSSVTDENLIFPDHSEVGSSITASLTGGLTHRRPASPAAGSLSHRSKAPSRGPLDVPPEEYTGPKLYVKPSQKQKSNRTIIINAISHCCLAGVVNSQTKNKVLEEIAKSDGKHFLILFRDGNQTYKALYSFCPDSEQCSRIYGSGPKTITNDMCHRFYKYNSGGKSFTEVLSTKHLSVSIDAITIQNHLWQRSTKKR